MDIQEMAPDLRKKVDAMRAARLAREAEMKKQVDAQVSPLSGCALVSPFSFGFVASEDAWYGVVVSIRKTPVRRTACPNPSALFLFWTMSFHALRGSRGGGDTA